ncbi:MAG: carboxylating nicotinate-nucleotide diphosphorylase [Acidobacteriaceae bacterium]|nr:carboxylating nicotinate-nucleotide diphosphorylase [Acidobacteriaceae bacterium]
MFDIGHPEVRAAVERALEEDIGSGDITSELTVDGSLRARGRFLGRQDLILAGVELLPLIYELRGGSVHIDLPFHSGDAVQTNETIALVSGNARSLLECERVALNFLQRLSGIATLTRRYVDAVAGTRAKVLDTRKTTPGLRRLEKMAAAAGGATNHRLGLFDAVLIKNNHIAAAGGVTEALRKARNFEGRVEIEVRTRKELDEALAAGAKHLLLDNLSPREAAQWIRDIDRRAAIELSGNIDLKTIRSYAETGPDYISCGAITHSAHAVDISFRLTLQAAECP